MAHHTEMMGWSVDGSRRGLAQCAPCKRRQVVGWYYKTYRPLGDEEEKVEWWWTCADCLVAFISDRVCEATKSLGGED